MSPRARRAARSSSGIARGSPISTSCLAAHFGYDLAYRPSASSNIEPRTSTARGSSKRASVWAAVARTPNDSSGDGYFEHGINHRVVPDTRKRFQCRNPEWLVLRNQTASKRYDGPSAAKVAKGEGC